MAETDCTEDSDTDLDGPLTKREAVRVVGEILKEWGKEAGAEWNQVFGGLLSRVSRVEKIVMASQAEIDAITQAVTALGADLESVAVELTSEDSAIATELQNFRNQGIDVTNLQAAVSGITTKVHDVKTSADTLQGLIPAPTTVGTIGDTSAVGGDTSGGTAPPEASETASGTDGTETAPTETTPPTAGSDDTSSTTGAAEGAPDTSLPS